MKRYDQFCSVSRSLDVVGDRWAMLVIRELMYGPRRYTDLVAGLPGIPSSVLSLRLRELEAAGVLTRRTIPPPSASTVYELTADGEELRPAIDALGRWGLRLMDAPRPDEAVRACWLTYSLSISLPAAVLPDRAEIGLRLDDDPNTLWRRGDRLETRWGESDNPLAVVESSIFAMYLVATRQSEWRALQREGEFTITGDSRTAEQFLDAAYGVWRTRGVSQDAQTAT